MQKLSADHQKRIRNFVPIYIDYSKSEEAAKDTQERQERTAFFATLTKDRILQMDEPDILGLITHLWAVSIWGNKQYILDKIISANGLEKLRMALADLLWGKSPVADRYERFLDNIKYLGPAAVTEMLASKVPDQCAIWNDVARRGLSNLGFGDCLPLRKYGITAQELARFNDVCRGIADELEIAGLPKPDLFGVDYFLSVAARSEETSVVKPLNQEEEKQFDHDEIGDHLRDIGIWLGFKADTRYKVAHGAEVDVLWRAQIGNLGVVTYAFEVQKSGAIDSLILNLQKARANPTVQKVVAVSDSQQLERIQRETMGLPADFRDALALISVADVETIYSNLSNAMTIIAQLKLVNDLFAIGITNRGK